MLKRRTILGRAGTLGMLALAAGGLVACGRKEPKARFHSVDISGVDYAKGFELTDFNGKLRTLADFKGSVVALFFGYTHCPDVCPTTMGDFAQAKQLLGDDGNRLQVLFISLDLDRDTPEILKEYLGNFDPSFLALRADSEPGLQQLVKDFKVYYQKVPLKEPGQYSVDHTAASFLFDPTGRIRLYARYGMSAQDLADDVRQLLRGA